MLDVCFFSYYDLCSEILSSVRRMEDSILRLKRVRESAKNLPQMAATGNSAEISDDNKIRKQIQHDVEAFTNEVTHHSCSHFAYIRAVLVG